MKQKEIVVFALRRDQVTGKNEGEVYTIDKVPLGTVNINHYSSPKLSDQQTFICVGKAAIKEGYERYDLWLGHKHEIGYRDVIREIKKYCNRHQMQPLEVKLHDENKQVWKVAAQMFFTHQCSTLKKHILDTFHNTNLQPTVPIPLQCTIIFTIKKIKK